MMTTAASTATDRSDFLTVMIAGTKTGALIALAVVVFLAATRVLGPGGGADRGRGKPSGFRRGGPAAAYLPALWAVPPTQEAVVYVPAARRGVRSSSGSCD